MKYRARTIALALLFVGGCQQQHFLADYRPLVKAGVFSGTIEQLKKLTEAKAYQEQRKLYYGYLDRDDCARLRVAYSAQFT